MQRFYIIGLGNPGREYEHTRHNAGFLFVDQWAKHVGASWTMQKKFHAAIAEHRDEQGHHFFFVKPQTFMNESGRAVRALIEFYDKSLFTYHDFHQVVVCYDDLDIVFGEHKLQFGKHPKVHNGVNSVISTLGGDQFWNVRIGTETRMENVSGHDYVLSAFTQEERTVLASTIENMIQEVYVSVISSHHSS